MQSFHGDTEDNTGHFPGHKKSKIKSLKTRLLGRRKEAGEERKAKLSQSASDITVEEGLGSEEDLACSQGMMGSRALSHDSIFLADQDLTDPEPARVLSQENVHSKIKALQIKLQQQKLHLGPPPLVLPIRRPEGPESRPEDNVPPLSPTDGSGGHAPPQEALSKALSQTFSHPLSPILKPASPKSVTPPTHPSPTSVPSNPSDAEAPLDFSSPAQFTCRLDTSAARHRMSIKPRNQRASTKKRLSAVDSGSLNNVDHPEPVREEEQQVCVEEEVTVVREEEKAAIPLITQLPLSKPPEVAPTAPEATFKSSTSSTLPQQDQILPEKAPSVPPQILRVKPHPSGERPHSSFIPSELKERRKMGFEIQAMSHDKRTASNKAEVSSDLPSTTFSSGVKLKSSSVKLQVQDETESTQGIKRPAPGSGSFHFSITPAKNRDVERPRSGSFVGVLEQTEGRSRVEDKPFSSLKEKAEFRDFQPRGSPLITGRLRQEGALTKTSVFPSDRRDSLKKMESVIPCKTVSTDSGSMEVEEGHSSQEAVEEAMEAQEVEEDDGKTAFGIKLRSTSQSKKFRPNAIFKASASGKEQKRQEIGDNSGPVYKKEATSLFNKLSSSGEDQPTDPAPSGLSLPVRQTSPATCDPPVVPVAQTTSSNAAEVEPAPVAPQEAQPAPQTAPAEVSWMSLAMEKTRSIQQLFTSRFPRDFGGVQTAARQQAQNPAETPAVAPVQTQTVKKQPSTTQSEAVNQLENDAVKVETVQSRGSAQTVRPSLMAVRQGSSSRELQSSKLNIEPQSHPHTTQSASQSVSVQANARTTRSPLHSSLQTETSSQPAHGSVAQTLAQTYLSSGQQQPPWSTRSLQLKSTTSSSSSASTTTSTTASPPCSALGREETEAGRQEKDGELVSGRRAVWAGSVSEKAAFLDKWGEWTTAPGTKGVEVQKARTEAQTSDEWPTPLSKDTKPEGRQEGKPAESSPTNVPERLREDKWLRKNVQSSSPPMQSMPDSGQPSWMELAKRKSMAWSDKSMD